jgi:hypothetical protein
MTRKTITLSLTEDEALVMAEAAAKVAASEHAGDLLDQAELQCLITLETALGRNLPPVLAQRYEADLKAAKERLRHM